MKHVDSFLYRQEKSIFYSSIHLFAKNSLVNLHNQKILKSLNFPLLGCVAECSRRTETCDDDNDTLEHEVLLCCGEYIMLTCNLWVEVGFFNGVLIYIEDIFFAPDSKPPQLPQFTTIIFEKYCVVTFDMECPKFVPVVLVNTANLRQIPLKMAWPLTIHNS